MDRSRLRSLHGNNNSAPPKKRLKPLFANHQQRGRIVKNNIDNNTAKFIFNNFVDEEAVQTGRKRVTIACLGKKLVFRT